MNATLRDLAGWLLLTAAAVAVVALVRPTGEDALPDVAASPRPTIDEIRELEVEADGGLPGFRARRATPRVPDGPLSIGGLVTGLALEDVEIRLPGPDGGALRADRGTVAAGRLALAGVRAPGPAGDRLVAGEATIAAGRIAFDGLVVFAPGGPDERVERRLTCALPDLARRLAGR